MLDVQTVVNHGKRAEHGSQFDQWMSALIERAKIRTAVHSYLRNQVVFHIAPLRLFGIVFRHFTLTSFAGPVFFGLREWRSERTCKEGGGMRDGILSPKNLR